MAPLGTGTWRAGYTATPVPVKERLLSLAFDVGGQEGVVVLGRPGLSSVPSSLPCPWAGSFAKQSPSWVPQRRSVGPSTRCHPQCSEHSYSLY